MFDKFAMIMEMHAELLHCMNKHCKPSDISGLAMRHHMCYISPGRPSAASTQFVICLYPAGCSRRSPVGLDELFGKPVVKSFQQVGPQAGASTRLLLSGTAQSPPDCRCSPPPDLRQARFHIVSTLQYLLSSDDRLCAQAAASVACCQVVQHRMTRGCCCKSSLLF